MAKHINVAQDFGMVLAFDLRVSRRDTGRYDYLVEVFGRQVVGINPGVQMHSHPEQIDLSLEVFQHLVELFFAGNDLGHVQLAADFCGGIVQVNFVAALCEYQCC